MKKLSTIFLIFFWVAIASILTAGLVFYQNKQDTAESQLDPAVAGQSQSAENNSSTDTQQNTVTLSSAEVAKHSLQNDCWMVVSGKVYNLTKYLGSHPGGVASMIPYCGKDGTTAFNNQPHSQNARNLLGNYYLGDLNSQLSTTTAKHPNKHPRQPKHQLLRSKRPLQVFQFNNYHQPILQYNKAVAAP